MVIFVCGNCSGYTEMEKEENVNELGTLKLNSKPKLGDFYLSLTLAESRTHSGLIDFFRAPINYLGREERNSRLQKSTSKFTFATHFSSSSSFMLNDPRRFADGKFLLGDVFLTAGTRRKFCILNKYGGKRMCRPSGRL